MSQVAFVPFKELDYPSGFYQNGSSTVIYNLAPIEGYGYAQFGAMSGDTTISPTALDTACRGAMSFRSGTTDYTYMGTTGRIYLHSGVSGAALTNVSQGGGTPYAASSTDWGWSFTRWGQGVIATDYVDAVQYKADLTTTAAFVDLFTSTLKPKAKFTGLVKNQLFVAYTNEGGTAYPHRVRWGAIDNALDMDSKASTQADYQDLLDNYGEITGFVGGDYGLVFKERAIYKVSYVGPPLIYTVDLVASGIGTRAPGSIVEFQGRVYFWAANGIYRVNQGGDSVELVPEGLFKSLVSGYNFPGGGTGGWPTSIAYVKSKSYQVHAVIDTALGCLYWFFPCEAASSNRKMIVALSPNEKRSSIIDPIGFNGQFYTPTWGIQGPYVGSERHDNAPAMDDGTSPTYSSIFGVNSDKKLAYFNSSQYITSRIISGMVSASTGKRAVISGVRPFFFCPAENAIGSGQVSPVVSDGVFVSEVDYTGIPQVSNTFSLGSSGWFYGRANGQFLTIGTSFVPVLDGTYPAVCLGWEVIFDEEDCER